ncbi:lipase family protein [Haliea sp. E17]|uniref:lipase family protein n=1 Tax=Haliea sp. E17 TaxID=3401576 RepID=UPI003AAF81DD
MTPTIKFNPQLCAMSENSLDLAQRNLVLAFLPYLGSPLSGLEVSRKASRLVSEALEALQGPLGPWRLLWGPGTFQAVPGAVPANTMFVAEHGRTGELFISIAGTNPYSPYAWFAEDFHVDETSDWVYGSGGKRGAISMGTLTGLRALQGMVPPRQVPGANLSLTRFLEGYFNKRRKAVPVTVAGHSLGGALAPAAALWLLDTQADWDARLRAEISVYAYAGPSPGDAVFADYIEKRFGDRLHRIYNPKDVVTHAWDVADLSELKALYSPELMRDPLWDRAVDFLITASKGIDYKQIDSSPVELAGRIKQEIVFRLAPPIANLVGQLLYQHTLAYFELLEVAFPEKRSALGRRLSQQSGMLARQILSRAGVWSPVSMLGGLLVKAFTETWSHMPMAPSPIPEVGPQPGDTAGEAAELSTA